MPRSLLVLAGSALIGAALYFARAIVLPIALATILAFVLGPIVGVLRCWGLARVPATLLVVLFLFSVLGASTWVLANQVMTVAADVPRYTETIKAKIAAVRRLGKGTALDRARGALNEVVNEVEKDAQPPPGGAPLPVVVKPSPVPSGRHPHLRASDRPRPGGFFALLRDGGSPAWLSLPQPATINTRAMAARTAVIPQPG